MVFLSDYDMLLTEHLVQGVDVWINTPRRPWEACGTSGMKVLVNGGLNLSELDGWWAEAYTPEVGWAMGDGQEHGDDPAWDAAEAEAALRPARTGGGPGVLRARRAGHPAPPGSRACARAWRGLTPRFSANRAVREYTEQHYLPAAAAYRDARGRWRRRRRDGWSLAARPRPELGHAALRATWTLRRAVSGTCSRCRSYLGDLDPDAVRVELYADGVMGAGPVRHEMEPVRQLAGTRAATCTARRCRQPAHRRTTRRA